MDIEGGSELNCPKWFRYVSCVIVYNSKGEILLGKRKKGQAEAGKWSVFGGVGAFGRSRDKLDFARRELQYDIEIPFEESAIGIFETRAIDSFKSLTIENYFYYNAGSQKVVATGNKKAPEEVRWFSMEEIEKLREEGKLAFDNFETIKEFVDTKTG